MPRLTGVVSLLPTLLGTAYGSYVQTEGGNASLPFSSEPFIILSSVSLVAVACGVAAYLVVNLILSGLASTKAFFTEIQERLENGLAVPDGTGLHAADELKQTDLAILRWRRVQIFLIRLLPVGAVVTALASIEAFAVFGLLPQRAQQPTGFVNAVAPAIPLGGGRFACVDVSRDQVTKGDTEIFSAKIVRFARTPRRPLSTPGLSFPIACLSDVSWTDDRAEPLPCENSDVDITYSLSAPGFAFSKTPIIADEELENHACSREHRWTATAAEVGSQVALVGFRVNRKGTPATYRAAYVSVTVNDREMRDSSTPLIIAIVSLIGAIATTVLSALLARNKA